MSDSTDRKKIGVYGGTFDPPHHGHINLVVEMIEHGGVDQVVVVPAHCSPHRTDRTPRAPAEQRMEMVRRAFGPIPHCEVSTFEVDRPPPSYTVETLRHLTRHYKADGREIELRLLIGEDCLAQFDRWHRVEEVVALAPPLVARRGRETAAGQPGVDSTYKVVKTSLLEISSTAIRERAKKGLYCAHLLPREVLDYIEQNELYSL